VQVAIQRVVRTALLDVELTRALRRCEALAEEVAFFPTGALGTLPMR